MAKVYLPFGYPVIQGAEFETLVYQGNLVRVYTVPNDPRNTSQLFSRRFLSDASKMRGYLGEVGRSALVEALGPKWSSVLFQIIKSDSFGWWSEAEAIWSSADEMLREEWRGFAPYEVTYNDRGWIYWGLIYTIRKAIQYFAMGDWRSEDWTINDAVSANAWFHLGRGDVLQSGNVMFNSSEIRYIGAWFDSFVLVNGSPVDLKESSGEAGDYCEILYFGKSFSFATYGSLAYGISQMYMNGVLIGEKLINVPNIYDGISFWDTKKRIRSFVYMAKESKPISLLAVVT